jgi:hypothetical protein
MRHHCRVCSQTVGRVGTLDWWRWFRTTARRRSAWRTRPDPSRGCSAQARAPFASRPSRSSKGRSKCLRVRLRAVILICEVLSDEHCVFQTVCVVCVLAQGPSTTAFDNFFCTETHSSNIKKASRGTNSRWRHPVRYKVCTWDGVSSFTACSRCGDRVLTTTLEGICMVCADH